MCQGSIGTFFPYNSANYTQIDQIIIESDTYKCVESVYVHDDHVLNSSDHHPITVTMAINTPRVPLYTRKVFKWDKADLNLYETTLNESLNRSGLCDNSFLSA